MASERIVRTRSAGNLAWLDLEMTGLDAQRDVDHPGRPDHHGQGAHAA